MKFECKVCGYKFEEEPALTTTTPSMKIYKWPACVQCGDIAGVVEDKSDTTKTKS